MTIQDANRIDHQTATPLASHSRPTAGRIGERAGAVAAALRGSAVSPPLATGIALAFEAAVLSVAGLLAGLVWMLLGHANPGATVTIGTALLAALAVKSTGGYAVERLRVPQLRLGPALAAWSAVFAAIATTRVVGEFDGGVSRLWYPLWYVAGVIGLVISTALTAHTVRRLTKAGRLQRRAVIVGGGPNAESLISAIEATGGNEVAILGIFDDRDDLRSPESQAGYPKLGTVPDLVEFARVASVDLLIVSIPMSAETRLLQLLKQLWVLPVDIRLAAHTSKLRLRPRSYSYIGRVPFLDLFDRPIAGWDSVVKRIFDVVFASLAIVVLSPVMLATALAVKLDSPGPVLFRQKRYGFNNEVISVLKFRSMYADKTDHAARTVVTRGDPRVTRVGRFIRRASLDELPQFFNVLKGDLSLVGPRPHAVNAHTSERLWEEVVDGYFARHKVKPGVTGWAQINGWRGEVDSPDKIQGRVECDLHYIENWSVLFDLYILLLTPIRIINQENAY